MNEKTDVDLVVAAQSGDTSAFNDLVKRHQVGVGIEAANVLGSVGDAEDVTQEAFLRAYLKLSSLCPPYNFGSWVRQIAKNIARNLVTRGPRFVALKQENASHGAPLDRECGEDDLTARVAQVVHALSRLSSPLRETARLSYLSHYSHRRIADRLCIPMGTVKRRLWEGRSQIRKEVEKMSRKGRNAEPLTVAPDIRIQELPKEPMEVKAKGPGLYFGTKLQVGHMEVCKFFDYSGGILTLAVQSQVVRKVEMLGHECYEVLIEHSDCEPIEPNVLDYFENTDQGFGWLMRVTADGSCPQTRFLKEDEEIFPACYSQGDHDEYIARVVELTVGDKQYGKCLAVFWGWQEDDMPGTPAESFYTPDGRQVLHRRFVGADAPKSKFYDYGELEGATKKIFRDKEYRLWYDTILMES